MTNSGHADAPTPMAFPRFFRIGKSWVSSYKVFLCIGIYSGILLSAAVGARSGISPLRLGVGFLLFAIIGLIGARAYHIALNFRADAVSPVHSLISRSPTEGGWSVLGGLVVVPLSLLFDSILGIPVGTF